MPRSTSTKKQLRRAALAARRQLDPVERSERSLRIAEHVARSRYFLSSRRLGCFLPMADEVDVWPLIERAWRSKKRVFVPVTRKKSRLSFHRVTPDTELVTSPYGIAEPVDGEVIAVDRLDTILVPLVAFDDDCNRIGMGAGYYDRALARHRYRHNYRRPKLIGLSFACQQVSRIPASPWDIRLFQIYTENGAVTR